MRRALQEAAARPTGTFGQWLRGSDSIPQSSIRMCGFYLHTGKLRPCVSVGIEGLESTQLLVPELFLILGHAFNGLGDYELSDFCFRTFLRAVPDAPEKGEIATTVTLRR
jgi:hypothetical protein